MTVTLRQRALDEIGRTIGVRTRISAGGDLREYYCVFRGSRADAITCVQAVLAALRSDDVPVLIDTEPDTGPLR